MGHADLYLALRRELGKLAANPPHSAAKSFSCDKAIQHLEESAFWASAALEDVKSPILTVLGAKSPKAKRPATKKP
jgi:hypothetical protein